MTRVLVLGARGFLGRHICKLLATKNIELIEADIQPGPVQTVSCQSESMILDVVSTRDFSEIVTRVDAIIYLVSTTLPSASNRAPIFDVESNLVPLIRLLETVKHTSKRLIFASSGGTVYGTSTEPLISEYHPTNPICSYGIVKLASEKYLRMYRDIYGFRSVCLRIANPYGIGQDLAKPQGTVGIFTHKILSGQPLVIWGDGEVVRDYVSANDVAEAFWRALEYEGNVSEFNIGTSVGTSINDLIAAIAMKCQRTPIVEHQEARTFDVPRNVLCNSLASNELGWIPRTALKAGLTDLMVERSADK